LYKGRHVLKKSIAVLFLLVVNLACFSACSAEKIFNPAEFKPLDVTNNTGENLHFLFISPGDSENWAPDALGAGYPFSNGDTLGMEIHYPEKCGSLNIAAISDTGNTYVLSNYNIGDSISTVITLDKSMLSETTTAVENVINVSIDNTIGPPLSNFFISPADSAMFGIDLLGYGKAEVFGSVMEFRILPGKGTVKYDVLAIDNYKKHYSLKIDLSAENRSVAYTLSESDMHE
jgi:hypothetical protein